MYIQYIYIAYQLYSFSPVNGYQPLSLPVIAWFQILFLIPVNGYQPVIGSEQISFFLSMLRILILKTTVVRGPPIKKMSLELQTHFPKVKKN